MENFPSFYDAPFSLKQSSCLTNLIERRQAGVLETLQVKALHCNRCVHLDQYNGKLPQPTLDKHVHPQAF